jgi:hypothetical protein
MAPKTVLAIGIDPAVVDVSRFPGLTVDLLRNYLDAELQRLGDAGYEVVPCYIDLGATAEQVTATALASRRFDCVMIGAGLRQPPEHLLLFETILNLVHHRAPTACICFNSSPADTLDAVRRWVGPASE